VEVDMCSPREWGCYSCEGIELKHANCTTYVLQNSLGGNRTLRRRLLWKATEQGELAMYGDLRHV